MKRRSPELDIQKAVMAYLKIALPRDAFCTAFPAEGGAGGFRRGQRMKAAGLVPGVPDIIIVWNGWAFFLEVKTPVGRVSRKQALCHNLLVKAGAKVGVCRGIDDVDGMLECWGVPLRASIRTSTNTPEHAAGRG
jgi:hypothetical protein